MFQDKNNKRDKIHGDLTSHEIGHMFRDLLIVFISSHYLKLYFNWKQNSYVN